MAEDNSVFEPSDKMTNDPSPNPSYSTIPASTATTTTTIPPASSPTIGLDLDLDLDDLLSLEETFYAEGHTLGTKEGTTAGLIEGRAFGLERAFDSFSRMGRLHGRATVWASRAQKEPPARNPSTPQAASEAEVPQSTLESLATTAADKPPDVFLPSFDSLDLSDSDTRLPHLKWRSLGPNTRLMKHVSLLEGLTEPESLHMDNSEDGVADFQDRLRRAIAKAGIVGRIVGEEVLVERGHEGQVETGSGNGEPQGAGIEDVDILRVRH